MAVQNPDAHHLPCSRHCDIAERPPHDRQPNAKKEHGVHAQTRTVAASSSRNTCVEVIHPQSELIECVAYNPLRRRMRVTFTSGRMVDFTETPDDLFRAFARAHSPDDFFETRIRGHFAWFEVQQRDSA
jgi:hypothetical protein